MRHIGRHEPGNRKDWNPTQYSRICSEHLKAGPWHIVTREQNMTQMDLLVTSVAELLATAVHEVLRLMGQAVSEYHDESARIRQENQKLQRTLEELQKRLQISDAVQQVSSSVAAEEPLYESRHACMLDCHSEREPTETEEYEATDSYSLSFEDEKPSQLHLSAETREPNDAVSSPNDLLHQRRRSFSSSRSQSASPKVNGSAGVLNNIKTESKSEFTECSLSEQTGSTVSDAHVHLPQHSEHVNPSHVSRDSPNPPHVHIRAENASGTVGVFDITMRRENSHTCHVCGKSFATASSLGAHFVCHSGERPFACERCKFRFSRLADLKKHERIHTGEKPYNCALCGRRFNRTENLKRHLRKVHCGALL